MGVAEMPDSVETTNEYEGALEDAVRFFERKRPRLEAAASDIVLEGDVPELHSSGAITASRLLDGSRVPGG